MRDDGTLFASAQRITKARITPGQVGRGRTPSPAVDTGWQADAWDMYGLVGELQFLVNTMANRAGQARFYVGTLSPDSTEDPVGVDDPEIAGILTALADSPKQLRQHVVRLAVGLTIVGEGWLVGIPGAMMPPSLMTATSLATADLDIPSRSSGMITGETDLDDIEWRALSTDELSFPEEGRVKLTLGGGAGEDPTFDVDDVLLIRVWRPHPRKAFEPDCPVRSLLPALRTLVGLDMRNAAQIDSRLAGAGMLVVPASAQRSMQAAAALAADGDTSGVAADQFTAALMEAMVTAVRDRSSASSFVPIVATVPDEATDRFNFLDFSKPLDDQAPSLVDQAIRRIALGMDCPPELLLGQGCVDDQTEALTARGWVRVDGLRRGDELLTLDHETGLAQWQPLTAVNRYMVDEDLYRVRGLNVDLLTTGNHRWPVERVTCGDCGDPQRPHAAKGRCRRCARRARRAGVTAPVAARVERLWVTSDTLAPTDRVVLSAVGAAPLVAKYTDEYVEAASWLATDGDRQSGGRARVRQSRTANAENCERIDTAVATIDGWTLAHDGATGVDVWTFPAESMASAGSWSGTRFVLSVGFVRELTGPQLELLLDVAVRANGHRQGSTRSVFAVAPERLEAFGVAAALAGYRTSWRRHPQGEGAYGTRPLTRLSFGDAATTRVIVDRERYTGEVWCPTVGNGSWYARSGGVAVFTGNSMNHWGAWLSSIETVHQHITPLVELIADALTTQYLWPVLVSAFGMSKEQARQFVVWFEVEHLIVRPNRAGEAMELFDRGIISADAVRREAGFEPGDAASEATAPPVTTPPAGDEGGPPSEPGAAVGPGAGGGSDA